MAIGIGSSTLIFAVTDALLLRPLPVRDPENLQAQINFCNQEK
jgi:hypothetical protein